MSATGSVRRAPAAQARPDQQPARTRLRAVPQRPAPPSRVMFVGVVVAVMAAGLVGLLLLNIAMQSSAFQLAQLDSRAEDLHIRQQALDLEVDRLGSPEQLAERASAQGMVPNPRPVFLDLSSGKVVGDPIPAAAGTGLPEFAPVVEPPRLPQTQDTGAPAPDPRSDDRHDRRARR